VAKGPTPRGEYVGKSSVFSTRIRPDLRQKLEQGAKKSGRSLSQEVEHRLRRTFVQDQDISEMFGDRRTFLLMKMMAAAIQFKGGNRPPGEWLENREDFEIAIAAALLVLEAVRPRGAVNPDNPFLAFANRVRAEGIAFEIWKEIKMADPALSLTRGTRADHWNAVTKVDLGEIADRVRLPASYDDEGEQE
jgi:hypothetical protein